MQLTNSSIAQLFTIPLADWTAINKRVGMVLFLQQIETTISQSLPGFSDLETACQLWVNSTYQSLIDGGAQLNAYAGNAVQNFTTLKTAVDKISGSTVPPEIQLLTTAALTQLQTDTSALAGVFATVSGQVANFMGVNQKIDAELLQYQQIVGPGWTAIATIAQAVDQASGLVNGAFQAINSDLTTALAEKIDVSMPFLESLSLELAIQTWQNIQTEISAFDSQIADQKAYWTQIPS